VHVTRSKCNVCMSLWNTACLGFSPDEIVAVISISLCIQLSGFCLANSTFGISISSSILRY
jgi:hypothetical protein